MSEVPASAPLALLDAVPAHIAVIDALGVIGVAHDFNNALQVIHAYAELLEAHLGEDPIALEHTRQILAAAGRAATLTHQLLALSCKQGAPKLPPRGGSETIFLVEDENSLRAVVRQSLQDHGYRVLEAADGSAAIAVAAEFAAPIDLLLTDIILPGFSGRSVANRLRPSRPAMRVIYMSCYADDFIANHGILDPNIVLLEKPFSIGHLLVNVRDTLDAAA